MLADALLLGLWAGICSFDDQGPQLLRRPLLVAPMVGIILGNLTSAVIIGATLELMWMGLGNMAGYQTPDMIVGTIIGTAFAIMTKSDISVGIALATAASVLGQQFNLIVGLIKQLFAPWADRLALSGSFDSILRIQFTGLAVQFFMRAIPVFLVIFLGTDAVQAIVNAIPTDILSALNVGSRILPAVGLSILMTVILKKGMWPFMMLGFCLNAYLGVDILGTTIISLSFASMYLWIMEIKDGQTSRQEAAIQEASPASAAGSGADDEEEEYDL